MGGGSFANHRPPPLANCVYFCVPAHQHTIEYTLPALGLLQPLPMCFIKAVRSIRPGEELFCNYGRQTCEVIGIPYDHPTYHPPKSKSKTRGCHYFILSTPIIACVRCGLASTSGARPAELKLSPSLESGGQVQEWEEPAQLEQHVQGGRAREWLPDCPEGHEESLQPTTFGLQVGSPSQMSASPLSPGARAQADHIAKPG